MTYYMNPSLYYIYTSCSGAHQFFLIKMTMEKTLQKGRTLDIIIIWNLKEIKVNAYFAGLLE